MALYFTDYVLMRGVKASPQLQIPCPKGLPIRVAVLLNEVEFLKTKCAIHGFNVYLEDPMHDWRYHAGLLAYYGRMRESVDLILVYAETDKALTMNFDPMSGEPLHAAV